MRRAFACGLATIGVALLFLAPAGQAAPAPKQESALSHVPEQAVVVIHMRGVERTKERLLAMIKNAVPDLADMVKQQIEDAQQRALDGRELKGLVKDGSMFLAFTELPDPAAPQPPKMAFIFRVTKYTDFRDGILKEEERKELKADPAGYETANIRGETIYFVDRQGYTVITLTKEVAEQFTKKVTGLDTRLNKETARKLLESDAAIYVDVGAIHKQYGDHIRGFQLMLQQGGVLPAGLDKGTRDAINSMFAAVSQVLEDGRAILISNEFRPEGFALHAQFEVKADSKTNAFLKNSKPSVLSELGKLTAGQMGYWAVRVEPERANGLPSWLSILLSGSDDDKSKAIKEALEELGKAGLTLSLSDTTLPLAQFQVEEYKDPNKASAATLKLLKALKLGEGPEAVIFKDKPKIKENDQTHREFKLHTMQVVWDFDKIAASVPGGNDIVDLVKKITGESMNVWFGTNGKVFVQITGKNWESARKRLDQYLDGKDLLADEKAYQEARKHLPAETTMLTLVDVPRSAQIIAEVVLPILQARGVTIPIEVPKNKKWKSSYLGMAITFQPERGSFDLWVPGAAIGEVHKMLGLTQKNAADR